MELNGLTVNLAGDDGFELNLGPGNQPSEAQPSNRGPVPLHILIRGAFYLSTFTADQAKFQYMSAKSAGYVMVLSVDVVGNRAADGDKLGARTDRQEPSLRNGKVEYLSEGDASFTAKNSSFWVE